MKKPSEDKLQTAVISYLRLEHRALYCASLGGQYQRYHSQRMKAKRNGYVAGFPDVFIYETKGGYSGLAIELKVKGNYPSQYQRKWIERLNERGYLAKVCTGFDEAKECIDNYFNLK
tara:strand:+ start:1779 stop:2129 length:351 start_codon:yes stop_codon:yes gene_type:complete